VRHQTHPSQQLLQVQCSSQTPSGLPAQQKLTLIKGILRMHHFYNIGAEWVSTIICVQVRVLAKPAGWLVKI
jgi:hypothetical protein